MSFFTSLLLLALCMSTFKLLVNGQIDNIEAPTRPKNQPHTMVPWMGFSIDPTLGNKCTTTEILQHALIVLEMGYQSLPKEATYSSATSVFRESESGILDPQRECGK
ncbi:hypothetical protein KC19_2G105700 [Ceratodon purpureus]|uniref:Uncharacterized protein n=1 Tax=Ceratodon purpureus TaxID=3225 RepID=A0A8T0IVC9_CERPU|nr:hypothetical protein KC19_2G105700 [Ceratodon purpureus]